MENHGLLNRSIVYLGTAIFIYLSCGCSSQQKLYLGPRQPNENLAHIVVDGTDAEECVYDLYDAIGLRIEGTRKEGFQRYEWTGMISPPLAILPGRYTLKISPKSSLKNIGSSLRRLSGMSSIGASSHTTVSTRNEGFNGFLCAVEFDIEVGQIFYI